MADLVGRGRYPHQRWFRQCSADDEAAVAAPSRRPGTTDLADRPVDELSGGQRQRVWIAMTLAQGTPLLLLDEPTTFLDLAHQVEVLDLLADLNEHEGRTIVLVLHDLNLACRYAHHLIAMQDGAIVAEGAAGGGGRPPSWSTTCSACAARSSTTRHRHPPRAPPPEGAGAPVAIGEDRAAGEPQVAGHAEAANTALMSAPAQTPRPAPVSS